MAHIILAFLQREADNNWQPYFRIVLHGIIHPSPAYAKTALTKVVGP